MLKKIILLLIIALPVEAFSQPFDCTRFRDGRFRTADPRVGSIVLTERRGNYQTESTESLKLVLRFNISWQDNCSFTLRLDKIIRNENKVDIPNNLEVKVKIVETHAGSYLQEISSSITNGVYRAEAIKTD